LKMSEKAISVSKKQVSTGQYSTVQYGWHTHTTVQQAMRQDSTVQYSTM
jgi:hypothetical protein